MEPDDLPGLFRARLGPGAAGASIDDQGQTPMRAGILRTRDQAFTPTPVIARKQVRIVEVDDAAEAEPETATEEEVATPPAAELSHQAAAAPADTSARRPARQAAIEANVSLTRQAQKAALGLGGSPGTLGSSMGIGAPQTAVRSSAADNAPAGGSGGLSRERAGATTAPGTATRGEQTAGPGTAAADSLADDIARRIADIEQQQRRRSELTTRFCRSVDELCQSGSLSISGAELIRAAVYTAMAHSQLGPSAPPLSPRIAKFVVECDPARPETVQIPVLAPKASASPADAAGEQRSKGPAARAAGTGSRRWEKPGARTAPRPPSAIVASLAEENEVRRLLPHQTLARVNAALEGASAPPHVRMGSSSFSRTGITIKPSGTCTVDELAQHSAVIRSALNASQVHDSRQWLRFKVLGVPQRVGSIALSEAVLQKEIEHSTGMTLVRAPHRLRMEGAGEVQYSSVQFAVLDDGKTAKCRHCGSPDHSAMEHSCKGCDGKEQRSCTPKCANCGGPHFPDSRHCKLAPRMDKRRGQWTRLTPGQVSAVKNQARIDHAAAVKALEKRRVEETASTGQPPAAPPTASATQVSAATGSSPSAGAPLSA
ncbi:hypothetical protein OC842_007051 [Tilletia horrida]|uniref:Uncharacterized protein n=1 Tax=Tilletia horrida TaxID=155126 RepID=A0AAN6JH44_9BASI|nr:hypothetical protein OC842_007051 [Tilletia horrida]